MKQKPRRAPPRRNGERTRARLLAAATREFSSHGFSGARIERIVNAARSNMKLLYQHFHDKEQLYVAVLEAVYERLRQSETNLHLGERNPVEALKALVEFTYDHFRENQDFVRLTSGENLLRGKFIRASKRIPELSSPLIEVLGDVLRRGVATGHFRASADALQIYVSIVALSCHHLNNRFTLSAAFQTDLSDRDWLDLRRRHVRDLILGYVCRETE
jgi:AcrR family transcriptional regulator